MKHGFVLRCTYIKKHDYYYLLVAQTWLTVGTNFFLLQQSTMKLFLLNVQVSDTFQLPTYIYKQTHSLPVDLSLLSFSFVFV